MKTLSIGMWQLEEMVSIQSLLGASLSSLLSCTALKTGLVHSGDNFGGSSPWFELCSLTNKGKSADLA